MVSPAPVPPGLLSGIQSARRGFEFVLSVPATIGNEIRITLPFDPELDPSLGAVRSAVLHEPYVSTEEPKVREGARSAKEE